MLESIGKIVYDPYRGKQKTRTSNWCVVEVDKEITRYYRWWLEYNKHIRLDPPSWDAHISVIRGEYLPNSVQSKLWKKYQHEQLTFLYDPTIISQSVSGRTDDNMVKGEYYHIPVYCPDLIGIRAELGLPYHDTFHLTIGRTHEYVSKHTLRKTNRI